jgi:hypothetical protein
MNGVTFLGRRFADERVLYTRAIPAELFVGFLRPKVALAAFTLPTRESVLPEERDGEFFLVNFQ